MPNAGFLEMKSGRISVASINSPLTGDVSKYIVPSIVGPASLRCSSVAVVLAQPSPNSRGDQFASASRRSFARAPKRSRCCSIVGTQGNLPSQFLVKSPIYSNTEG